MSKVRFIYPLSHWGSKTLQIQREDEDGCVWGFNNDYLGGLQAYCDVYGATIADFEWRVWTADEEYVPINAKNIKDFDKQFKRLNIVWRSR